MPGNFWLPDVTIVYTWPTPNYVDPVERKWLGGYSIAWLVVSSLMVFGRFYLRLRKQAGTFGFDDTLIAIAWVFATFMSVVAVIGSNNYLGRHMWDIPFDKYPLLIRLGYYAQISFLISMCTTKLSVLLFYRRMVKNTYSRKWLYILWAAIFFNTSAGVATLIVYLVICEPLEAYWLAYKFVPSPYTTPYTCIHHGEGLTLSSCIISVITDTYAVAIPYLMLKQYKLDVPRRQKVALNTIFALGWFATGCGIARTYYLWAMGHPTDLAWTGFDLLAWSLAEVHIGIVCACAPSLRAFFRQYVNISSHRNSRRISRRPDMGVEEAGLASPSNTFRGSNRDSAQSQMAMADIKHQSAVVYEPTTPLPPEKGEIGVAVSDSHSYSTHSSGVR